MVTDDQMIAGLRAQVAAKDALIAALAERLAAAEVELDDARHVIATLYGQEVAA